MSPTELADAWRWRPPTDPGASEPRLPIKILQFNRCPAIAPLDRLDEASQQRLKLDLKQIEKNHQAVLKVKDWPERILLALAILDKEQQTRLFEADQPVEAKLYDGFFDNADQRVMERLHTAGPEAIAELSAKFQDPRLKDLALPYKARNFPAALTDSEQQVWRQQLQAKLIDSKKIDKYLERVDLLRQEKRRTTQEKQLLDELYDYAKKMKTNLA
jgi:exodeoxyribonuclease-1